MKILLIEDDIVTTELIKKVLGDERLFCDVATNGEEALQISKIYQYDAVILDLGLPDMNGYELLQKFRENSIHTPILVLSGYQSIQDKVKALGYGADDYMVKPFVSEELIVRLKALIRRSEGHASAIVRVGELELNLDAQCILARGVPLELTGKEYQILEFLLMRKNSTVTKANFLNHLYSGMDEPEEKIIDVFMCKIRRKLQDALGSEGKQYIETVWGRGYVIRDPESLRSSQYYVNPRFSQYNYQQQAVGAEYQGQFPGFQSQQGLPGAQGQYFNNYPQNPQGYPQQANNMNMMPQQGFIPHQPFYPGNVPVQSLLQGQVGYPNNVHMMNNAAPQNVQTQSFGPNNNTSHQGTTPQGQQTGTHQQ